MRLTPEAIKHFLQLEASIEKMNKAHNLDEDAAETAFSNCLENISDMLEVAEEWIGEDLRDDEYVQLGVYIGMLIAHGQHTRMSFRAAPGLAQRAFHQVVMTPVMARHLEACAASFAFIPDEEREAFGETNTADELEVHDTSLTSEEREEFNNIIGRMIG